MAPAAPTATEPDTGEAETPEVVQPTAAMAVREETDSERRANEAIVAASDAAINNPGIPGRDEFLALAMQARVLSMSGAAPELVQNNPHLAFHIAMVGRDLGISPSAALELIDVIPGRGNKPPKLSLSPQLINGQIRRLGLGSIVPVIKASRRCIAVAMGPDGFYDPRCKPLWPDHHERCECTIRSFIGETEFTWEMARNAGLVAEGCEPGKHTNHCKDRNSKGGCNNGYVTYPERMLWWRASGFLADDVFPEASLGMYTPEALGALVDGEGRPVDPATVELPDGYEPKAIEAPAPKETGPVAAADVLDDLRVRVAALPDAQRATYREKWLESQRLRGFTLENLPEDRLNLATSMLVGFEKIAGREGWDAEAARAEVLAAREESPGDVPQEARGGAESDPGPVGAEEHAEAHSGPQGPDGGEPEPAAKPKPDPEIAAVVRTVIEGADPKLVATVEAEVAAMHHASVDRALREAGEDPEGLHIDSRRGLLLAFIVTERASDIGS